MNPHSGSRSATTVGERRSLVAGVTGGLLAKISHDLGDVHTAPTQSRSAFLCAGSADHDGSAHGSAAFNHR